MKPRHQLDVDDVSNPDTRRELENYSARADVAARAAIAVGVVCFVLLLALDVGTTLAVRDTQSDNAAILATLEDCTEPGGDCYRQSQRRTARAVLGIESSTVRVVAAAQVCDRRHPHAGPDQLIGCITRTLHRLR